MAQTAGGSRYSLGRVGFPIADTGREVTSWIPGNQGVFAKWVQGGGSRSAASWESITRVMRRYYLVMATELQQMVVEEYEKSVLRPNVATGRLAKATLDPRNVDLEAGGDAAPDGFSIGVSSFLNRSQAKYWRQIESGTSRHVGRKIAGVWGSKLTGRWAPAPSGRYAITGAPFAVRGAGTGQKFQPFRTWSGSESDLIGNPRRRFAEIRKPIRGQDAYTRAFRRFMKSQRALDIFRAVVAQELGLPVRKVPRGYQAAIDLIRD